MGIAALFKLVSLRAASEPAAGKANKKPMSLAEEILARSLPTPGSGRSQGRFYTRE